MRTMRQLPWLLLAMALGAGAAPSGSAVDTVEALYADWLDAEYAAAALAAGPAASEDGLGQDAWRARAAAAHAAIENQLRALAQARLAPSELRVLRAIERGLAAPPAPPAAVEAAVSSQRCAGRSDPTLAAAALQASLYACFEQHGRIEYDGRTLARTTALALLQRLGDHSQREALFRRFAPLWSAVNGDDEAASPYRRLVGLVAAAAPGAAAAPIAAATRTVGSSTATVEAWLVAALDAWRAATDGPALEPWDYWYERMAAIRELDRLIPPARVAGLSALFYRDLGADLDALGVEHDLGVRPSKPAYDSADFVRIGRWVDGRWRSARSRVVANVEQGGLLALNELVHEDGHAVHMAAVRTRPAYFDLGEPLFYEAFADVTSWSVAEPAWQRRYLGRSASRAGSLKALYAGVALDVAWALFEMRMLRAPDTDPNALWAELTSRYLHLVPHPELAWWALRTQLVEAPGSMIDYALGAVVTAELRQQTRRALGPFDAGRRDWYRWTSRRLLRYGNSVDSAVLLTRFLGRPVSNAALLAELRQVAAPARLSARP